jgi:2-hydroxy-3-keto-5-methylthiopentenyl-1-phosphate phosphatase
MKKILVQCDFDGTITCQDQAFLILDGFATGPWRGFLADYQQGRITVGEFNQRAFALVREDEETLVRFVRRNARLRSGFQELIAHCREKGLRFVIVSNGLDFYIRTILSELGLEGVEVYAARTRFNPGGIKVKYLGPDGKDLQRGFKEAYTRHFLAQGYRVVYVGNGASDIFPAGVANHVFACDELLALCRKKELEATPFDDMNDIRKGLELMGNAPGC